MSKQNDRREIVHTICESAKLYKANLVGKKFLYLFEGRYIEVIYKADNFKHLTGVESSLSAKAFYRLAVKNQLGANQISFSSSHPYQLCLRKLKHLNDICTLTTSESFMLEEIQTATRIFKFGATDLHFSLCFNQQLDDTGKLLNETYHVESLRDEDCFSKSETAYEIDAIL